MSQNNFQISGSRTKMYSATNHSKQTAPPANSKTQKLISVFKSTTASPEEEITILESFILEHQEQNEFKPQYYHTIFYNILEQRILKSDWIESASYLHILHCFQCVRLLARESSLLVLFVSF